MYARQAPQWHLCTLQTKPDNLRCARLCSKRNDVHTCIFSQPFITAHTQLFALCELQTLVTRKGSSLPIPPAVLASRFNRRRPQHSLPSECTHEPGTEASNRSHHLSHGNSMEYHGTPWSIMQSGGFRGMFH